MSENSGHNSVKSFLAGVWEILVNLQVPSVKAVLTDLLRAVVVITISSILFAVIDSVVAPIARFLLNG
jgi:hypothetical protein